MAKKQVTDRQKALWTAFKKTSTDVLTIHEKNVVVDLHNELVQKPINIKPTTHKQWLAAVKSIDNIIKL